jgi:hypothetical protein
MIIETIQGMYAMGPDFVAPEAKKVKGIVITKKPNMPIIKYDSAFLYRISVGGSAMIENSIIKGVS